MRDNPSRKSTKAAREAWRQGAAFGPEGLWLAVDTREKAEAIGKKRARAKMRPAFDPRGESLRSYVGDGKKSATQRRILAGRLDPKPRLPNAAWRSTLALDFPGFGKKGDPVRFSSLPLGYQGVGLTNERTGIGPYPIGNEDVHRLIKTEPARTGA